MSDTTQPVSPLVDRLRYIAHHLSRVGATAEEIVMSVTIDEAIGEALRAAGSPCVGCDTLHLACQSLWFEQKKCCPDCTHRERIPMPDWAGLLLECRDALPAITLARARSIGVDLSLADRIEDVLKPWRVKDDDPEGV